MPSLLRILPKGRIPKRLQRRRNTPAKLLVPQMHSNEMSPLATEILKPIPPVDERQVVDEVYVARLQRDLDTMLFRDGVN
jgi:hypothetical protein